jgi:hypothetical protein
MVRGNRVITPLNSSEKQNSRATPPWLPGLTEVEKFRVIETFSRRGNPPWLPGLNEVEKFGTTETFSRRGNPPWLPGLNRVEKFGVIEPPLQVCESKRQGKKPWEGILSKQVGFAIPKKWLLAPSPGCIDNVYRIVENSP